MLAWFGMAVAVGGPSVRVPPSGIQHLLWWDSLHSAHPTAVCITCGSSLLPASLRRRREWWEFAPADLHIHRGLDADANPIAVDPHDRQHNRIPSWIR